MLRHRRQLSLRLLQVLPLLRVLAGVDDHTDRPLRLPHRRPAPDDVLRRQRAGGAVGHRQHALPRVDLRVGLVDHEQNATLVLGVVPARLRGLHQLLDALRSLAQLLRLARRLARLHRRLAVQLRRLDVHDSVLVRRRQQHHIRLHCARFPRLTTLHPDHVADVDVHRRRRRPLAVSQHVRLRGVVFVVRNVALPVLVPVLERRRRQHDDQRRHRRRGCDGRDVRHDGHAHDDEEVDVRDLVKLVEEVEGQEVPRRVVRRLQEVRGKVVRFVAGRRRHVQGPVPVLAVAAFVVLDEAVGGAPLRLAVGAAEQGLAEHAHAAEHAAAPARRLGHGVRRPAEAAAGALCRHLGAVGGQGVRDIEGDGMRWTDGVHPTPLCFAFFSALLSSRAAHGVSPRAFGQRVGPTRRREWAGPRDSTPCSAQTWKEGKRRGPEGGVGAWAGCFFLYLFVLLCRCCCCQ
eukprot:Rhum_TRINITY_DN14938_c6_g4::Rhum_TRINITY_DN14938_c6_g4_i1::g.130164::m.130164